MLKAVSALPLKDSRYDFKLFINRIFINFEGIKNLIIIHLAFCNLPHLNAVTHSYFDSTIVLDIVKYQNDLHFLFFVFQLKCYKSPKASS